MRLMLSVLAILFLAAPSAHAMQEDIWNFAAGESLPDGVQSLSVAEQTPVGIHVRTDTDGFLFWNTPFLHPVDIITIRASSAKQVEAGVLWHSDKFPGQQLVQYFTVLPSSGVLRDISLAPADRPNWNWQTDQLALGLPAGTDIVIDSIRVQRYSTVEKIAEAWKSFWIFDTNRAYSINFLWGPLLAFNPLSRAELFDHLPPPSWSADRLFYLLIIASAVIGLVFYLCDRQHGKRTAALFIGGTFVALWLLFDLRMGLEIMHYATTDIRSYVNPPENQKTFRTHGNFYTRAQSLLPALMQTDHYVLIAPEPSPYYGNLRYITYPSVPVHASQPEAAEAKLWLVMDRPDVRIQNDRLVDKNGKALSGTGHLVQMPDNSTLLFAVP